MSKKTIDAILIPFNQEYILQASVDIFPQNGFTPDLVWSSKNQAVKIVQNSGGYCKLKGTMEGPSSLIIAKSADGTIMDSCKVTVLIIQRKIASDEGYMLIRPTDTLHLKYIVLGSTLTVSGVFWALDYSSIASIEKKQVL